MIILAIDTTTKVCGVALCNDGTIINEYTQNIHKTHSQRLLPLIDAALKDADLQQENIDAIAVASGPGSFTGVRIGVSTARAFAQAMKIPAVGISTLEALAQNIITASPALICPILDARRSEVYTAVYLNSAMPESVEAKLTQNTNSPVTVIETETILPPSAIPVQKLLELINHRTETAYFPGDGLAKFTPILKENLGNRFGQLPSFMALNRAASVAALAYKKIERHKFTENHEPLEQKYHPLKLLPYYIRQPEAERLEKEERSGKAE